MTIFVQQFVKEKLAPEPAPSPDEAAKATPAPARPDPIAWLVQHKDYWPKEVILRQPMEFPAVSKGRVVGSLTVPAGAEVKVMGITGKEIAADFMGGTRRVPIAVTDLPARAEATVE